MVSGDPIVEVGEYGALLGEQTVPNAEAAALLNLLIQLEGQPRRDVRVYADATSTILGWRNLKAKAQMFVII